MIEWRAALNKSLSQRPDEVRRGWYYNGWQAPRWINPIKSLWHKGWEMAGSLLESLLVQSDEVRLGQHASRGHKATHNLTLFL